MAERKELQSSFNGSCVKFLRICQVIFIFFNTNYMFDELPTGQKVLTSLNAIVKEINANVESYIEGEMETFTGTDKV